MNYNRPQISIEERDLIRYYAIRFDFLMIGTLFISLIGISNLILLNSLHLYKITGSTLPDWVFDHSGTEGTWQYYFIAIFIVGQFLNYIGRSSDEIKIGNTPIWTPSNEKSGVLLAINTFIFISLISLPIFYLGGAKDSIYSIVLVTACALSVVFAKSWKIRIPIGFFCMLIYVLSSFYYVKIEIALENEFAYTWLFDIMTVVCIGISFFLSKRNNRTLFE